VASENDRFAWEGQSEFSFTNPQGIRFEILTFSRTVGCRPFGVPTLEYTWFPGHAWSCCVCDRCGMHLGWHYTGPSEFAGLIRCRIVRAALVRN
jgi:cereblon